MIFFTRLPLSRKDNKYQDNSIDKVIDEKENNQVDPQSIEKVPIDSEQAQLKAFLRVGKVNQDAYRLLHPFSGGPEKGGEKGQACDDVSQVQTGDNIEIARRIVAVDVNLIGKELTPADQLQAHEKERQPNSC